MTRAELQERLDAITAGHAGPDELDALLTDVVDSDTLTLWDLPDSLARLARARIAAGTLEPQRLAPEVCA